MRRLLGQLVLFGTMIAAACAPAGAAVTSSSSGGGAVEIDPTLRIALGGVPANMTPQGYSTNAWLFWPLYDNLTQFGENFEVKPSLATSWQLGADGRSWTFTLRPDVKWPDGTALTADDVAFTMNTIIQLSWTQRAFFSTVTEATATSPTTVVFATRIPDMSVPNGAPYLFVISKAAWERAGGFAGYVAKPVGSGPYEMVEYKAADTVRFQLRSQPHAFRSPVAKELIFRAVPDNGQTVNGLRTADVDMAILRNFTSDQADQLKVAGLVVQAYPVANSSIRLPQGAAVLRGSPIVDKRVRLAMNYAVDKEAIANRLYKGYAAAVGQTLTPGSLYWDPEIQPIPYNVARAKQLLAEAGYPNGLKLPYGFDFSPATAPQDVPVAIQGYLRDAGIEVEIINNDFAVFVDKVLGRNNAQKGDMIYAGTGESTGFNTQYRNATGCGKPLGGPPDAGYYCNPQWDVLMDQALGERDPGRRRDLYRQAVRVEREDLWTLYTVTTAQFHVFTTKVRGVQIPLGVAFNLDSAYKVK